ncbi:hypothetical protein BKA80DRAFT_259059 [Phyllosticta citrichinensis]
MNENDCKQLYYELMLLEGDEKDVKAANLLKRKAPDPEKVQRQVEKRVKIAEEKAAAAKKTKQATDTTKEKEIQELCNALALKRNMPSQFTFYTDSKMQGRYNRGRQPSVEWQTWISWPQCCLCGTRRIDQTNLVRHLKSEHVGAKDTEKRRTVEAEIKR